MRKTFIYPILMLLVLISCSKDSTEKSFATPSVTLSAISVENNVLGVSVTIDSPEELPSGTMEFKIDDSTVNTFSITKGTKTYTTDYMFTDLESHKASVIYNFSDGREAVNKSVNIKKSLQEILDTSSKSDWVDF